MPNAVFFVSYKLKKGTSASDFFRASKNLNDGYMSKQKGFISWKQLNEGDTWVDLLTFETMEDAKRIEENDSPNALAEEFYSYINLPSCKVHFYTVEKSY